MNFFDKFYKANSLPIYLIFVNKVAWAGSCLQSTVRKKRLLMCREIFLYCFRNGVFLWIFALHHIAQAHSEVTVLSSHRKVIQREFVSLFEQKTGISVNWLDLGGTENSLRYLKTRLLKKNQPIGVDIFWGGGDLAFDELERLGGLRKLHLDKQSLEVMPDSLLGVPLLSAGGTWRASAISGFGIFSNRVLLQRLNLAEPKDWSDLAEPQFKNLISLADPRHSSSALVVYLIMMLRGHWEDGWKDMLRLAYNARRFTHSSSDPIKDVVSGEVALSTAIDFYAYAKIQRLGVKNLSFHIPENGRVFTVDPIGILKDAPHYEEARKFVTFVLSNQGQRLYTLPRGHPKGPKWASLARMGIRPGAYDFCHSPGTTCSQNPFKQDPKGIHFPTQKARQIKAVVADLIGSILIDMKSEMEKSYAVILRLPANHPARLEFEKPLLSYRELVDAGKRWNNPSFRLRKLNRWIHKASSQFRRASRMTNFASK